MIFILKSARLLVAAVFVGFVGALLAARLLSPKPAVSVPADSAVVTLGGPASGESGESGEPRLDETAGPVGKEDRGNSELEAEIEATVRAWARAWSEQRVDDYFDFYSVGFEPVDGMALSQWRQLREVRINPRGWIRVTIGPVVVRMQSPDSAVASFEQSYESATYRDRVRKKLRLVLEDGSWLIEEETAEPI